MVYFVQVNPEPERLDIDGDDDPDEFEFSDDDAEAVFQRMAPKEVSTSQPQATLQRPGRSQAPGRRYCPAFPLSLSRVRLRSLIRVVFRIIHQPHGEATCL